MRKEVYPYCVTYSLSDGRLVDLVFRGSFNEVLHEARSVASARFKAFGVRWRILEIKRV